MGRGGHGPGMGGAGHSHDAEFPDDDWNLYQHLDEVRTRTTIKKGTAAVLKCCGDN